MDKETLNRTPSETPAPEPQKEPKPEDDKPTECGLTRKELRAIVEEVIG